MTAHLKLMIAARKEIRRAQSLTREANYLAAVIESMI